MKPSLLAIFLFLAFIAAAPTMEANRHRPAPTQQVNSTGFVDQINNPFFQLVPGTTFLYQGAKDGVPTSDTFTVTHQTKKIAGITCRVITDLAYENGVLVERTADYFAQDTLGNVWYFGEDTAELDANGNVVSTEGTWRAGVNGAQQGIIMEASPRVGDSYNQENAPGVAQDMARVSSLNKSACVPHGCFDDLLQTRETSPLDPGSVEEKLYAAGVGFIRSEVTKGGSEFSELVSITKQ